MRRTFPNLSPLPKALALLDTTFFCNLGKTLRWVMTVLHDAAADDGAGL